MNSRWITFVLILFGGGVAVYAQAGEKQNTYLLIIGLVALMLGLFRLSKGIPDKKPPMRSFLPSDEEE